MLKAMVFSMAVLAGSVPVFAAPPEIAHIHPDWPEGHGVPNVITGESFGVQGFELWVWSPPSDDAARLAAVEKLAAGDAPALPAEPPQGARRVEIRDLDGRVAVANLGGAVAWARNADGWSKPYLLNVPKPFWLSTNSCTQGSYVHAYGFGMRYEHEGPARYQRQPGCRILLLGPGEPVVIEPGREGRSTTWIADARLLYFHVPPDATPGSYQVYVHNGNGGELGWVKIDDLEVLPREAREANIYDVRDFGAAGDGLANDLPALQRAMTAATDAGGGIVHLPPGTYRVERTVEVPKGVRLRGAGMENTIILGTGFDPHVPRTSMITLTDSTALDSLSITGAVSLGVEGNSMIQFVPQQGANEVSDVSIVSCRLRVLEEHPETRETMYLRGIAFGRGRDIIINNNEIFGSLWFSWADRMEIIRNKWYDTTATIVVSIHGWAERSILDSNIFSDTPGRVCFYPVRHCYIRYNEIHQAFKGTWTNAEEIYLVHGGVQNQRRTVSRATSADETTLTDTAQQWRPGMQADSTVLITAGRGMGQFRRVTGNTADTLTVDRPWRVVPDETSEYFVGMAYCENAFYANLNNTPLRMSLWLDCISNIVDRHRDVFSKGIDIWAQDSSRVTDDGVEQANAFNPSWYNMIVNGWMDGGHIRLVGASRHDNANAGPPFFANAIAANKIRQPHMSRTGFDHHVTSEGGIVLGGVGRDSRNTAAQESLTRS